MALFALPGGEACFAAFLLCTLAVATFIDVRTRKIPNTVVVIVCATWCVRLIYEAALGVSDVLEQAVSSAVFAALVLGGFLLLTLCFEAIAGKASFGGGDIKLIAATSLYFGPSLGLLFLLATCVSGLFVAVLYKLRGQNTFPFGPAIALGALAALFLG